MADPKSSKDDEEPMQRSVFPWVLNNADDPFNEKEHSNAASHKPITALEIAELFGIPRPILKAYIEDELDQADRFSSLPFTIVFVIAYTCMIIVHDDAKVIRAVEDSISFDIIDNANFAFDNDEMGHKAMYDVANFEDFWSWTSLGFADLIFSDEDGLSEGKNDSMNDLYTTYIPIERRGIHLHYNRIIGGIRFSQERGKEQDCAYPEELWPFWNRTCYGVSYAYLPESYRARVTESPSNVTWFWVREPVEAIQARIFQMEMDGWVDEGTNKVEIAIPYYTAEFGLHSLITVNFYFSRGGMIWKQIIPLSTYATWFTRASYAVTDVLWLSCLLYIFGCEFLEVKDTVRKKGYLAIFTDYMSFWNAVDWISVLVGFVIVLLAALSFVSTAELNDNAAMLGHIDWGNFTEEYKEQTMLYVTKLEEVVHYVHKLKLVMAGYPLIIVLRLFKAFSAQERLAIVTKTLSISSIDLMHFMLVFSSVFVSFAISGQVLFGRRLEGFVTLPRAINTVFRLMLGDFDWEEIRSASHYEGAAWLVLTMGMINLLLLNIVLAIVMDGYGEAKKGNDAADTLPLELYQILSRWWRSKMGTFVPLNTVCEALYAMDKDFERKKRTAEHEAKNANHEKLLGRDTKAKVGMRVEPTDKDIKAFVGPGKVEDIGHTRVVCRVRHEDSNLREYNIGQDILYELKLADGETSIPLDDEDTAAQTHQIIKPERLVKVVQEECKKALSSTQAQELLVGAVKHHYAKNSAHTDENDILRMMHETEHEMKEIGRKLRKDQREALNLSSGDEMRLLHRYLEDFFAAIDDDRQNTFANIMQLQQEVDVLYERLITVKPEELELGVRLLRDIGVHGTSTVDTTQAFTSWTEILRSRGGLGGSSSAGGSAAGSAAGSAVGSAAGSAAGSRGGRSATPGVDMPSTSLSGTGGGQIISETRVAASTSNKRLPRPRPPRTLALVPEDEEATGAGLGSYAGSYAGSALGSDAGSAVGSAVSGSAASFVSGLDVGSLTGISGLDEDEELFEGLEDLLGHGTPTHDEPPARQVYMAGTFDHLEDALREVRRLRHDIDENR